MPKKEARRRGDVLVKLKEKAAPNKVKRAIEKDSKRVLAGCVLAAKRREERASPSPNLWKMTASEALRPREGEKRKDAPTAMPSTRLWIPKPKKARLPIICASQWRACSGQE